MSQFPKMLYRAGGDEKCHGLECQTRIVNDADEQEAALSEGYALSPIEAHGGEAPPRPVADVEEANDEIDAMRDEIDGLKQELEGARKSADESAELLKAAETERDAAVKRAEAAEKERDELKAKLDARSGKDPTPKGEGKKTA